MADRNEAESADESASAAHPEQPGTDDVTEPTDGSGPESGADAEELAEHVAPDDAREPTVEELEQLLEGDDSTDSDDSDGSDGSDGDSDDLVSVGAAPAGRSRTAAADGEATTTGSSARAKVRSKKEKATPKQKKDVEKRKRTTPVSFTKEAVGELRKVVYPTAPQLGNYFVVVLVFVLIIIGFVGLLDLGFGWLIVKIFG